MVCGPSRSSRRSLLIAAFLASCATPHEPVAATKSGTVDRTDAPNPEDAKNAATEETKKAVSEAHAAARASDYEHALQGYERAYRLKPEPLILFNVAQVARKAGHLLKAHTAYTRYLEIAPAGQERVKAEAQKQLDLIESAEKARKPSLASQGLVAVLEIKTQRERRAATATDPDRAYVTTPDTNYLTDVVRSAAAEANLNVVTRENVVLLLKGQGHTPADCIDQCEVDTGRMVGADYVVSGELISSDQLRLSLRLHNTVSAHFLAGVQASGVNMAALEASMKTEVQKLFARIHADVPH